MSDSGHSAGALGSDAPPFDLSGVDGRRHGLAIPGREGSDAANRLETRA